MKGDFSRYTFDPRKNYAQVLMQQGRVLTDADWNEQQAITQYHTQTEAKDIIGPCGVPALTDGFRISVESGPNLLISPGRIYIDGILCENFEKPGTLFTEQLYLPNAELPTEPGIYLVYLDVWQRHLTYLDDATVREVALGGPDTTTRLQTIWQVKLLLVSLPGRYSRLNNLIQRLRDFIDANDLRLIDEIVDKLSVLDELLEKVINPELTAEELITVITSSDGILSTLDAIISTLSERGFNPLDDFQSLRQELKDFPFSQDVQRSITCNTQFEAWDNHTSPSTGTLNTRTRPVEEAEGPCLVPPNSGYQRLENQLYRVEIHQGGNLATATFKWSRDNGSVVTQIINMNGQTVTVADLGKDAILGFATGQWVEVLDAGLELSGQPGQLAQIIDINPATQMITLSPAPTGIDRTQNPKLRRWDSAASPLTEIPTEYGAWMQLEAGIEVQFSEGSYRTGDYWLIPARTAISEVEWPPYEVPNINPIPQLPLGIEHHYCRLAILRVANEEELKFEVEEDCRRFFGPTTLASAIHVTDISWQNDAFLTTDTFENGLRILLDAEPIPAAISRETMIVTIEVPFNSSGRQTGMMSSNSPDLLLILDHSGDTIEVNNRTITWIPEPNSLRSALNFVEQTFGQGNTSTAPRNFLVRVTLKGHKIWAGTERLIYLDGQTFGQPIVDGAGNFRTGLIFPSGDGKRASDFESWFYLSRPVELEALIISPDVVYEGNTTEARVRLTGPSPIEGTIVNLRSIEPPNAPVSFPTSVVVPANATEVVFTIGTRSVSDDTRVTIQASLRDRNESGTLTVQALPELIRLTLNPNPVQGGNSTVGTIFLSRSAPVGGVVVNVSSSNGYASFQRTLQTRTSRVRVSAGSSQATFDVFTPESVPAGTNPFGGNVRIQASFAGTVRSANLTVTYLA